VSIRNLVRGFTCVLVAYGVTGCAPTPGSGAGGPKVAPVQGADRKSPAKAGEVAAGSNTLEGVRRQLEGTWEMTSLEVVDSTGKSTPVTAGGKMTYDAYGNFDLAIQLDPATAAKLGANASALSVKGRAVIDVANSSFRVMDVSGEGAAPRPDAVARVRHYAFEGDVLTLSTRDAAGKIASASRWTRKS
jgi:hypothetical protein